MLSKHRAASLLMAATLGLLSAACPQDPIPFTGMPPEYEPPRQFPGGSAAALPDEDPPEQAPPYGSVEELGANVDAYLAGFGQVWGEAYKPSGIFVIAKGGVPLVTRTFGQPELGKAGTFSLDSQLRIGSLTKQFVAAATLSLADAGSLKLTDSVRKYVKELPETFEAVTLHHLLAQTSGIPNYLEDAALLKRKNEEIPQADVIASIGRTQPGMINAKTLNPQAPLPFVYSNSNYFLLGVVIERAAGKPLATVLETQLFAKAGMKATGVAPGAQAATGYMRGPGDKLVPADNVSPSLPFGAGYLRSTVRDLLAWDRALGSDAVLKKESRELLFKPNSGDYGYGWVNTSISGNQVAWHNGKIDGFGSFMARAPGSDLTVVLLSNVFDFDETNAGRELMSMALTGKPGKPPIERPLGPIDDAVAKSLVGEYVLSKETRDKLKERLPASVLASIEGFEIKWENGSLTGRAVGQSAFPLKRSKEGALFYPLAQIELIPDFGDAKKPEKKAKGLKLMQGSLAADYVRGKMPKPKPAPKADPKKPEKAEPKSAPKTGGGDGSGSGKGTGGGGGKSSGKGTAPAHKN